jgi:hypothetical protein
MHQRNRRATILGSFVVALMLAAGLALSFGGAASAQDMKMSGEGHPAHVHTGLCPTPGAVVFPLTDVSSAMADNGTPMASGTMMGAASAIPVQSSVTKIATKLADIADGNHSIVVHESAANIGNYLVCGDIGGAMMGSSDLAIGLGTLNNSGFTGVATLHDNGDGSTNVTIFLISTTGAAGSATPVATPAG